MQRHALHRQSRQRAFTLVELMVVLAVLAVVALLAVPSFTDFLLVQRLKSINAQLVTDLQFARSEATTRNLFLRMSFRNDTNVSCYSMYVTTTADDVAANAANRRCDCTLGPGNACSVGTEMSEVRTVQVPKTLSVALSIPAGQPSEMAFDPVTGGLMAIPQDNPTTPLPRFRILASIDDSRSLRTTVNRAGRVTVCGAAGSLGVTPC
jgi:type IV fimbrial biogenesis protein FimT